MNPMTGNTVSIWVAELGMWPLVVFLLPNLLFPRRYGNRSGTKRMANLYQAIAVFAITTAAGFVAARETIDLYFYLAVLAVALVLILFRKKVFPYRRSCEKCDMKLDMETIYFREDNLCISCRKTLEAEEDARISAEAKEAGETDDNDDIAEEDHVWPGSGVGYDEDDGDDVS